jgi:hypothetical protein
MPLWNRLLPTHRPRHHRHPHVPTNTTPSTYEINNKNFFLLAKMSVLAGLTALLFGTGTSAQQNDIQQFIASLNAYSSSAFFAPALPPLRFFQGLAEDSSRNLFFHYLHEPIFPRMVQNGHLLLKTFPPEWNEESRKEREHLMTTLNASIEEAVTKWVVCLERGNDSRVQTDVISLAPLHRLAKRRWFQSKEKRPSKDR